MRPLLLVLLVLTVLTVPSFAFVKGVPRVSSLLELNAAEKKAASTKKVSKKADSAAVTKAPPAPTVRKPEFLASISEKTGVSKKDADAVLTAVLETIQEEVSSGKRINFLGFGTFKLSERSARTGRNPQTGESIEIKASKSLGFTVSKSLKEKMNPQ